MRAAAILLISVFGLAAWMLPAQAVPTIGPQTLASPSVIEAARCGPHSYWAGRHRYHGHWMGGHCRLYRRYRHH